MKKLTFILLTFIALSSFAQRPEAIFTVPNNVTAFGQPLPVGQIIYDKGSTYLFSLKATATAASTLATISVDTLNTASSGGGATADSSFVTVTSDTLFLTGDTLRTASGTLYVNDVAVGSGGGATADSSFVTVTSDTLFTDFIKPNSNDTIEISLFKALTARITNFIFGGKTLTDTEDIKTAVETTVFDTIAVSVIDTKLQTTDSLIAKKGLKLFLEKAKTSVLTLLKITQDGTVDTVETETLNAALSTAIIDSINYINPTIKIHRLDSIDVTTINSWVTVKFDTLIASETTYGFKFNADSTGLVCEQSGIADVCGCSHFVWRGGDSTSVKIYTRVTINSVEARCLQTNESRERKASDDGTMGFCGSLAYSSGDVVRVQYYVTNADLDFEGSAIFDNPVAFSIKLTKGSN